MRIDNKQMDFIYIFLLIVIVIGLPCGIWAYDRQVWQKKIPSGVKDFTLTGHTQKGWLLGDIRAFEVVSLAQSDKPFKKPVITVRKGDRVVFKLKSSDVVHGFSFPDAGIVITDGIKPGKVVLVSFTADKIGTFTFSCNAICGDNHQNMQGTVVVRA